MHRSENRELADCIDCGATISPGRDRGFAITDSTCLCFTCAIRRGGVYDGRLDRWASPPDVSRLPDERRPHERLP